VRNANANRSKRLGRKKWQHHVEEILERLIGALKPDDVVIGGGNAKKLKGLPAGTRLGDNANAFIGGMRLWEGKGNRPQEFAWSDNSRNLTVPRPKPEEKKKKKA
jgi:hypothetical protein